MSDSSQNTPASPDRSGFTVDLSSGSGPSKPARPKGFAPVVQQTINLTTKKAAPQDPPPAENPRSASAGPAPRRSGPPSGSRRTEAPRKSNTPRKRDDAPRADARPSGGTSLADLLDEATLARLRGGA